MILIKGGRVYDPLGDTDLPGLLDVLVDGDIIVSVTAPEDDQDRKRHVEQLAERGLAEVIDARDRLIVPGFVNAHYHSYDTLVKGLVEDAPFDLWAMHSQPAFFGPRSKAELRLRTLLGAIECLRQGITTVQDMCTLVPQDEETLDIIASAYREVGIRVVFALALRDLAELDIAPFLPDDLSEPVRRSVTGTPRDPLEDLAFVDSQIRRLPSGGLWHWGVAASGPQRSSDRLLEGVASLSDRYDLPVFTHVYETKAQTAKARRVYASQGGSMMRHMAAVGFLGPRTTMAHGVWIAPDEIDLIARSGARIVHNPLSNMKLKSGVAPIAALKAAGIPLSIGCDNCSCGDCQNMFQGMKMFCLLAGVADPNPTGVHAVHAIEAATRGGAQAVGLGNVVGAIAPGLKADLSLIDLSTIAYLPLNSVARQLVFSETGQGVDTVMVGGRIVMRDGRLTTVDEAAFRAELNDAMPAFRRDFEVIRSTAALAAPALLEANRRVAALDVGLNRFLGDVW
ncbi:amidohydrolase family protein [Lichenihabitans psoromatis]|uniref:amidohydrolase family protein n=1 Tax=Lichenihabitans psoromatis TaxID=2528642 RepID=UPI0010382D91|nr:amidohydrolase family protein [Lichenihabitans psoromatis]